MSGVRIVQVKPIEQSVSLYAYWIQERRPQPAYLLLNMETGELRVDGPAHEAVRARPMMTPWRKWRVESLTLESAYQLLQDVEPVAQRMLDSSFVEYNAADGSYALIWPGADGVHAYREVAPLCEEARRRRPKRLAFAG